MCQRSNISAEEDSRRESADSRYRAVAAVRQAAAAAVAAAGAEAAWRGLDRVHELCWQMIERALLGRGAGDEWVAGRVRRLGSGDAKRGAISLPSERIGCHWFGFHLDLGALGWQD